MNLCQRTQKQRYLFSKLTNCFNEAFANKKFPDTLKLCSITPAYKNLDPSDKVNYRPVSLSPLVSEVFEKFMYDQLYEYIENSVNFYVASIRLTANSMISLDYRLLQKWRSQTRNGFVAQHQWIYSTHITVCFIKY